MENHFDEQAADVIQTATLIGQAPRDVNRILAAANQQYGDYYDELQRYGIQRTITRWIFITIITYVLRNEGNYSGSIERRTAQILDDMRRDLNLLVLVLRGYGVPNNLINQLFTDIISFTLRSIGGTPAPGPSPGPTPGWSNWEDLGGVLTSAPAVASWQPNRLDVFGRGQNNALWHKYWDGRQWSGWEDLGGVLTSPPAAVSWGPNRIDIFARGQNQSLWHLYWDQTRWSSWEDLGGGSITSGSAAASTGVNRLEIFSRGSQNQLLFRTWNGNRWTGWQSLGGVITSEPAAVSWGGNRLDVFARGQNNSLWHIWRA